MVNTYTVLDIETTGLSAAHLSEVIEVAAYHTDGEIIFDEFHEYIKPWKSVPKKITEITGITNEMLKDKSNKWNVLPRLRKFIGDSIVVAHNASFDFNFLNTEFFNIEQPLMTKYICTQKNFKKIEPKHTSKLASVAEYYKIDLKNAHSADADAYATAEIFIKMLKTNELETVYLTQKEALMSMLKRLVSAPPHKAQTLIMTNRPKSICSDISSEADIIAEFRLGHTPNDICCQCGNDYREVTNLFISWINNIRATKFYALKVDRKINKEIKAMVNLCNSFDELIDMHEHIFEMSANLSIYALYWAEIKNQQNMKYTYKDFEWHFFEQKEILDIANEFSISPFLVADNFVEFCQQKKEEFRLYISRNLCTRSELKDIVQKNEYINIVSPNPKDLDIKKYISKKLYDKNFFKISFE